MWMRFWRCSIWCSIGFICFWSFFSYGQDPSLILMKRIAHRANIIEADGLGNIYLMNDQKISKLDLEGNVLMQNSSLTNGRIASVDASNALKIIVYYKDLSQIVYLDNLLASRGEEIALQALGLDQVSALCRSYNDGLWIYDQTTFELQRFDDQLQTQVASGNIAQILGFVPHPNYIREFNNWLYVNDAEMGVLVFDWYGSYTKTIPILGSHKFVLATNRLYFIKENKIQYYILDTQQFSELPPLDDVAIDFTIFEDMIYIITGNELLIYKIHIN